MNLSSAPPKERSRLIILRVEGCAECERLWQECKDATEAQMKAAELLRLGLKHLGDGSITVPQRRRSAKAAREQLEVLRLALREHEAKHEQRD
jgi:hypothetical protein